MKLGMINGYDRASFEKNKSLGLDFVEICCNYDEDNERLLSSLDDVKRNIKETGVVIGSIGRWNFKPNVEGKVDPAKLEQQLTLMRAAAELGSPVFVCGCNYDESVSLYKNYVAAVDYFSAVTAEAKKLGIKAAIYNCSWENFVNSPEQWKVVLGEIPELMIKYDISHTCARGNDYIVELSEWLPRIAHMHVKGVLSVKGDYIDNPPAGMDEIEWPRVFALLYKYGYDGGLSIEPHSAIWTEELGEAGIKYTVNFIRPYILR